MLPFVGPGLVVSCSVIGVGGVLAVTRAGAHVGFSLLWLVLLGCVVKVFAQVELARYCLSTNRTTLAALNQIPGPRLGLLNWIVVLWFLMWVASLGQFGGIAGGIGQALSTACPLTERGREYNAIEQELARLNCTRQEGGAKSTTMTAIAPDGVEIEKITNSVSSGTNELLIPEAMIKAYIEKHGGAEGGLGECSGRWTIRFGR